ncbi:MAG: OmpA family protein [Polaromonas sp.]
MFSQDDDGEQRVALFVVFGLIALVLGLVLAVGVSRGRGFVKAGPAAAPAVLQTQPAIPMPIQVVPATAQAAADAASVKVEQGVVKFYFASGKADLAAGAGQAMADLVKGAQAGRKLVISGFHDATGDAVRNAELARQRALAVREALKAAGVAEAQIELKKPEQVTGSGSDAEARRVEITLE